LFLLLGTQKKKSGQEKIFFFLPRNFPDEPKKKPAFSKRAFF